MTSFGGATARHLEEAFAEASGRAGRVDPVLPGSGGPAGNASLTAWTAMTLLVLGVAELLTLLDVRGLISWHVAIGALLVPPALLKTASTGWRIVRYYAGAPPYRTAGPPPLVLRLLGPVVVLSTLALLGTGVVLVLLGEASSRQALLSLGPWRVDWITLHQAAFAVWAVATGLHVLGRLLPMVRLTVVRGGSDRAVPGRPWRLGVLGLAAATAAVLAVLLVGASDSWQHDDGRGYDEGPTVGAGS
jgi:hypothetical protein